MDASTRKGAGQIWDGATQLATQILEDGPGQPHDNRELGKKVSDTLRELFVVCDPAEALRQHFELGVAPFVLLHDLGGGAARSFLQALSMLGGWPLQTLSIRRQGFGTVLATLQFLDCPAEQGGTVRLYLAQAQATPAEQGAIRQRLAASAGLQVVLAEALPEAALTSALQALSPVLRPAGSVLVLPQRRDPELVQALQAWGQQGALTFEVGPATATTAPLWALMATHWNRQARLAPAGRMPVIEQVRLLGMSASPEAPAPRGPVPLDLDAYLRTLVVQTGAHSGCVFQLSTRAVEAQTPGAPGAELAAQGHALLASIGRLGSGLNLGRAVREAHVTLGDTQVLVRPVRVRAGSVLILLLPRAAAPAVWRAALDAHEQQWAPPTVAR